MQIGDKVTYAKIKETQHLAAERRDAVYTVLEFGRNGTEHGNTNEEIVKVETPWGGHTWILKGWLVLSGN